MIYYWASQPGQGPLELPEDASNLMGKETPPVKEGTSAALALSITTAYLRAVALYPT
jgi:hypothetical protein